MRAGRRSQLGPPEYQARHRLVRLHHIERRGRARRPERRCWRKRHIRGPRSATDNQKQLRVPSRSSAGSIWPKYWRIHLPGNPRVEQNSPLPKRRHAYERDRQHNKDLHLISSSSSAPLPPTQQCRRAEQHERPSRWFWQRSIKSEQSYQQRILNGRASSGRHTAQRNRDRIGLTLP
jgi:hypothetical protein